MVADLLSRLETATLQGTLFFAAVWLACKLLKRLPAAYKCWLWRLSSLRLLIGLGVAISIPSAVLAPKPIPVGPTVAPASVTTVAEEAPAVKPAPHISQARLPRPVSENKEPLDPMPLLLAAWIAGLGWSLVKLGAASRNVRRLIRQSEPMEPDGIPEDLPAKRVRIRSLRNLGSPVIIGVRKPTILIPADYEETSPAALKAAVAHELAHLQRHDVAWALVSELVKVIFWFDPATWIIAREQRLESEIAADQLARTNLKASPKEYATHLLEWIEPARRSRIQTSPVPGLAPSTHELIVRLKQMSVARYGRRETRQIGLLGAVPIAFGLVPLSFVVPRAPGLARSAWPMFHSQPSNDGLGVRSSATGKVRWEFSAHSEIVASPTIGPDGTIYVGGADGRFFAVDPARGTKRWSFQTGALIESSGSIGSNGMVYVGSEDDSVYALDAATGKENWHFTSKGLIYASPLIGPDGTVYVGSWDSNLYALNGETGTLKWTFKTAGPITASSALGPDGTIYVGSHGKYLYAIDSHTGVQKWAFQAGAEVNDPSLGPDGTVYAGCWDSLLYAVNGQTGKLKWTVQMGDEVDSCPAIGPDGTLFVTANDQRIYAFDPKTGDRKWEYVTAGQIAASPAIGADDTLYAASEDHRFYALDGRTGRKRWTIDMGSSSDSSPCIAADGTLYVGTDGGVLLALK